MSSLNTISPRADDRRNLETKARGLSSDRKVFVIFLSRLN